MKKNKLLILTTVLLGALAIYYLMQNKSSTFKTELREFAVKDTAAITKIFLADRNGNSIVLNRGADGNWLVNDTIQPKKDVLKSLLDAIYKIDVKENVAKSAYNNTIKSLSSTGIKCEIYLHNESKPYKIYYVGESTPDILGTYMMLENSTVPFIMEIPGFNGYLTPRYTVELADWKDPVIFSYSPEEIQQIEITYSAFPERNLSLRREGKTFAVSGTSSTNSISVVDTIGVDNYLSLFKALYYESREGQLTALQHDSLRQTQALCSVSVTDIRGAIRTVTIFPMPISEKSLTQQDSLGNLLKYDVDRMIGFIPKEGEWVVIQHYTFDRIFRSPQDFDLEKRRKYLNKGHLR